MRKGDLLVLLCVPAASRALEALRYGRCASGYRRSVPHDLADCGSTAHHSGGTAAFIFSLYTAYICVVKGFELGGGWTFLCFM